MHWTIFWDTFDTLTAVAGEWLYDGWIHSYSDSYRHRGGADQSHFRTQELFSLARKRSGGLSRTMCEGAGSSEGEKILQGEASMFLSPKRICLHFNVAIG